MESTIMHWMYAAVNSSNLYDDMVSACGGNAELKFLLETLVPPLTRTMVKKSKELSHVLSLVDTEYVKLHREASRALGWKGRARDFKGQLFKMKATDSGLLLGWSSKAQAWTYVIPHSLQKVMFACLDDFYSQCDHATKAIYARYTESLERDFMTTQGQRASERGLHDIAHRRGLMGRRNKFVIVPKVH